jgi:hypothetical protein
MKVLRHLGLSNQQAVTEDGQARIETELLSRKWTRRSPASPALIAAITDANLAHVTDELRKLAEGRLFDQKLEVEVLCLGGDPARARAVVEHLVTTTRCTPDRAKRMVIDALAEGRELTVPPGNS